MTSLAAFRPFTSFAAQALQRQLPSVQAVRGNDWFRQANLGSQVRGKLAVDVGENNQVERAMRILRRKALNEKYEEKWRQTYHVKKGEKRRQELKKSKFTVFKAEFRDRMRWIMQRRARGF